MNPATVKKLLEDIPEVRELLGYIDEVADELNKISDIETINAPYPDIALEVLARKRAYEKLTKILEPFVNAETRAPAGIRNKDYDVDI